MHSQKKKKYKYEEITGVPENYRREVTWVLGKARRVPTCPQTIGGPTGPSLEEFINILKVGWVGTCPSMGT